MHEGELVVRESYQGDIVFKIASIIDDMAVLRGTEYRLLADAPLDDLRKVPDSEYRSGITAYQDVDEDRLSYFSRQMQKDKVYAFPKNEGQPAPFFDLPGKILHLDGDPTYLRKSMSVYGHLRIPAEGHFVHESNMPEVLYRLLPAVKPDIVVITGHDGIMKNQRVNGVHQLSSYKNSNNFVQAVEVARHYERNRDSLTVIAGACQSHFEALLQAGANFASSPGRILIHALDPVYIAAKASFTSIKDTINIYDVIKHTISGIEGLGGIETRGSYRVGLPKISKEQPANLNRL